jgi:uncharacterized membrane protein
MTSYSDYRNKQDIDAVFSMWFMSSIFFLVCLIVLVIPVVQVNSRLVRLEAEHKPPVCEVCGK